MRIGLRAGCMEPNILAPPGRVGDSLRNTSSHVHSAISVDVDISLAAERHAKLAAVFRTYYAALVRYACSLNSGDSADAEDVIGDTFFVLSSERGDLLDDGEDADAAAAHLEHYLYSSVRNRIRNSVRNQQVRARYQAQGGERVHSA